MKRYLSSYFVIVSFSQTNQKKSKIKMKWKGEEKVGNLVFKPRLVTLASKNMT
jgi:hypothetical protein